MTPLFRKVFLRYVDWRTSPQVVARRRRRNERKMAKRAANGNWLEKVHFFATHGYWPSFLSPTTYSEKLCAKKLYDRNPLLTQMADKHLGRQFVLNRLGSEAESLLVPQLAVYESPDEIDFDSLHGSYVMKANHASKLNYFHFEGQPIDEELLRAQLKLWLARDFGVSRNEWAYLNIPRRIVVERMLSDDGRAPSDIKFYCFSGKVKLINILDRSSQIETVSMYFDADMNKVDVRRGFKTAETVEVPRNMPELVTVAEKLSEGFDFLRVDLYSIDGHIYVGELTNYPGAGRSKVRPKEMDAVMGLFWEERQEFLPAERA